MSLLTIADMQKIIAKVSYRPGWKFRIYQGETRGAMLEVLAEVDDSVNIGKTARLEIYAGVPPYDTEKGFLTWLFSRLKEAEIHECLEFLKLDGKVIWDPHAAFTDRDLYF